MFCLSLGERSEGCVGVRKETQILLGERGKMGGQNVAYALTAPEVKVMSATCPPRIAPAQR